MDIHQAYRIAYEAALAAQIVSLTARLEACRYYTRNDALQLERELLSRQINALTLEVRKLNQ